MFTEELGLILELQEEDLSYVIDAYTAENIPCHLIGYSLKTASDSMVSHCWSYPYPQGILSMISF